MSIYEIIGLVLLIILLIAGFTKYENKLTYRTVPLFSPAEKNFLKALDRSVGKKYRIFAKVRIADIVLPGKMLNQKQWRKHFWKISSKHIDYVLCDYKTLDIVCLIELNDKSHQRKDRKDRDILVTKICESANIPLVWINVRRSYDSLHIENKIAQAILQPQGEG